MKAVEVAAYLDEEEIRKALDRHQSGDWGECEEEHRKLNEQGVKRGGDLLSVYRSRSGTKFWVVTQGDRSKTEVMMATGEGIELVDEYPA